MIPLKELTCSCNLRGPGLVVYYFYKIDQTLTTYCQKNGSISAVCKATQLCEKFFEELSQHYFIFLLTGGIYVLDIETMCIYCQLISFFYVNTQFICMLYVSVMI